MNHLEKQAVIKAARFQGLKNALPLILGLGGGVGGGYMLSQGLGGDDASAYDGADGNWRHQFADMLRTKSTRPNNQRTYWQDRGYGRGRQRGRRGGGGRGNFRGRESRRGGGRRGSDFNYMWRNGGRQAWKNRQQAAPAPVAPAPVAPAPVAPAPVSAPAPRCPGPDCPPAPQQYPMQPTLMAGPHTVSSRAAVDGVVVNPKMQKKIDNANWESFISGGTANLNPANVAPGYAGKWGQQKIDANTPKTMLADRSPNFFTDKPPAA